MIIDRIKCAGLTAWCAVKDVVSFAIPWVIVGGLLSLAGLVIWNIWRVHHG